MQLCQRLEGPVRSSDRAIVEQQTNIENTAFALQALVDDLGKGLASFIIAMMIVGLGGRVPAFNVAFTGWVIAGILFCMVACTIRKDLAIKNERLLASLKVVSKRPQSGKDVVESTDASSKMSKDEESQIDQRRTRSDVTSIIEVENGRQVALV